MTEDTYRTHIAVILNNIFSSCVVSTQHGRILEILFCQSNGKRKVHGTFGAMDCP
jgi:hypothetical protein